MVEGSILSKAFAKLRISSAGLALWLLLASGCVTLNKADCVDLNWQHEGYLDGAAGASASGLLRRRMACVFAVQAVDEQGYRHGWEIGIQEHCQSQRAFHAGRSGQPASNQCPKPLSSRYFEAHGIGVELATAEAGLVSTSGAIERLERQLSEQEAKVNSADARLDDVGLSTVMKFLSEQKSDHHRAKFHRLEDQLFRLEQRRWFYNDEIERLSGLAEALESSQ